MRLAASWLPGLCLLLGSGGIGAQEVDMLSGIWTGTYECAQGLTAMTLSIEGESGHGVFEFGPLKSNKSVPKGSYEFTVVANRGGYTFEPGEWIVRPENYVPVRLSGQLSPDQMQLHGTVEFQGCSTFEANRDGPPPVTNEPKTKR